VIATPTPIELSVESIDRLFARLDDLSRKVVGEPRFFDELQNGWRDARLPGALVIWLVESSTVRQIFSMPGANQTAPSQQLLHEIQQTPSGSTIKEVDAESSGTRHLAEDHLPGEIRIVADLVLTHSSAGSLLESSAIEELVLGIAQLTASFLLRQQVADLRDQARVAFQQKQLLELLCTGKPLEEICGDFAAWLLGTTDADRVSLIETSRHGSRLLGIAPAGDLDLSLTPIQRMEQLASTVRELAEPIRLSSNGFHGPPEYASAVTSYYQSGELGELSIAGTERLPGDDRRLFIFWERRTERSLSENSALDSIMRLARPALRAIAIDRRQGASKWFDLWRLVSLRARWLAVLGVLLVALLSICIIPATMHVTADGTLVPVGKRGVFAPRDGVIIELLARHGMVVKGKQPLLVMQSHDLELEFDRLKGEEVTLESRLAALRATRAQLDRQRTAELSARISVQEEDLKIQIAGTQDQLKLLNEERSRLTVLSPVEGTIEGQGIERTLLLRPTKLGEHLFDVVDPHQGWELHLEISDQKIGYVAVAQQRGPCQITFRLRSDPLSTHVVDLDELAPSAEVDSLGRVFVLGIASLEGVSLPNPRSGSRVSARIDCGTRSLGYVWFHELIEFAQRRFWF
jgi:hypothetical protein